MSDYPSIIQGLEAMRLGEVYEARHMLVVEQFHEINKKASKERKSEIKIVDIWTLPPMHLKSTLYYEKGIFKLEVL